METSRSTLDMPQGQFVVRRRGAFLLGVGVLGTFAVCSCDVSSAREGGNGGEGGESTGSTSSSGASSSSSTSSSSSGASSSSGSSSSSSSSSSGSSSGGLGASGLPPPATTGVAKPSGAVGGLQVVNWAGFKAAVSYNFDDSNSSQLLNYAALKALDVKFTFYMWGQRITQGPESTWATVASDGNELGNHTWDHTDANMSQSDVDQCSTAIKSDFNITTYTFAAPNGTAGWAQYAMTHHFMDRGVADGLMMPGDETTTSPWALHCYIPPTSAPTSAFNSEIDGARAGGGWRVILVHGFTGGTDGAYQPVDIGQYTAGVTYAKSFPDLWIDTMLSIGAYWRGQNAFDKATMTTSGTSTKYTWTLPANFPPNRYLRVTLTGGNITQNGTTLAWDTHGYYEISLDAGSLTVGP